MVNEETGSEHEGLADNRSALPAFTVCNHSTIEHDNISLKLHHFAVQAALIMGHVRKILSMVRDCSDGNPQHDVLLARHT